MPYNLQVKELTDTAIEVAASDEASLAVVRDEARLHGYAVGDIHTAANGFSFRAESDEPGKVREFLMGLTDVQVRG